MAFGSMLPMMVLYGLHVAAVSLLACAEGQRLTWERAGFDFRPLVVRCVYPACMLLLAAVFAYARHFLLLQREESVAQEEHLERGGAEELVRAVVFGAQCAFDFIAMLLRP